MAATESIRRQRQELNLSPSERPKTRVPADTPERVLEVIRAYTAPAAGASIVVDPSLAGSVNGIIVDAPREMLVDRYRKDAERLRAKSNAVRRSSETSSSSPRPRPTWLRKSAKSSKAYRNELARVLEALSAMGETA